MEFLEIKNSVVKMKKFTVWVEDQSRHSRREKKKNSELEHIAIKTIQNKAQKEKGWEKN